MDRRTFLKTAGASVAAAACPALAGCDSAPERPAAAPAAAPAPAATPGRLPVLFTAHGSPENALADNAFTRFLDGWAAALPRPEAIVCVSAHFEDLAPVVTAAAAPETLHDYYNFPPAMYALRYGAPGSPAVARRVADTLRAAGLAPELDPTRGLDHGCWAPLMRCFPAADIPVVQVSLYISEPPDVTLALGRALAPLRDAGVLLVGSGNITHNLRGDPYIDPASHRPVADWGVRFDDWVRARLDAWDLEALRDFETASPHGRHAHPTTEHFEPLLVACGAADVAGRPRVTHAFEGFQGGNFSMRCVVLA